MSTKLTDIEEICARLSMLEFALEVVMANQLSQSTEELSLAAKGDFVRVMAKPYGPITADMSAARQMQLIAERSVQMASKFVEKVARREAEIRAQRSQDQ